MFNSLTKDEIMELKHCVNTMIGTRHTYLHSDISEEEKEYTKKKLAEDYDLLGKILDIISKKQYKQNT